MPEPVELETLHSRADEVALASGAVRELGVSIVIVCGALNVVLSGMPSLIAAASTNGLNVEPAWKPAESPYFVGTT